MSSVKYAKVNGDFSSRKVKIAGKVCDEFSIITPLLEADYIINLPKLKTHGMMVLSGAVKNMFGAVPGLLKPELHYRYSEKSKFAGMIVDLCQFLKPNFTLVDAVVAMDGDGPSSGTRNRSKLIVASENPFQLDVVLCKIIGLDTKYVPISEVAFARGLAVPYKKSDVIGDANRDSWPLNFKSPVPREIENFLPGSVLKKVAYKLLSSKPLVIKKECIGCGKCSESCPAKTIDIVSGKAIINYKNCIKCYCCHEMCPVKAIIIKRAPLFGSKP